MSATAELAALVERHRQGSGWAPLAQAITLVENAAPWELGLPQAQQPAHVVGITGPPGSGKSTLTGRLIEAFADSGSAVAVVAVDPSSTLTGGAVLGDRVRMERQLIGREGVFVRSLASRGSAGALAAAAGTVVRLLEATGSFDVILVETVGAGQTELAIANLADTVLLVTVPGLGDAVQAIKAGLMEVADLVVINMADRPGAAETARHIRLALGRDLLVKQTIATEGVGTRELHDALEERWRALQTEGLAERRAGKTAQAAAFLAQEWVRRCAAKQDPAMADELRVAVKAILEQAVNEWQI